MAKISYRENGNEIENLYRKTLIPSDRYNYSSIRVNRILYSKKQIKGITQHSLLPEIAAAWGQIGADTQNDWKNFYSDFFNNGYKAFCKAYTDMRKFGLTGLPVANPYYLGKVGVLKIEAPANRLHIKQDHPNTYYVMKKIKGTKSQYQPIEIDEFPSFPINFEISYKSDLVSLSANSHARFYIRVYTDYQGRRLETDFVFPINLINPWTRPNMIIEKPLGTFKGYEFHIDLYDVRGTVYFDNLVLFHNGKNWARDPHCSNVRSTFTRKYYQVAAYYDIIDLPNGANFLSIYYENE